MSVLLGSIAIAILCWSCLPFSSTKQTLIAGAISSLPLINTDRTDSGGHSLMSGRQTVSRMSCLTKSDCAADHTECDPVGHRCRCRTGFVEVRTIKNRTLSHPVIPNCRPAAKLNQRCESDEQCVVRNTVCVFQDPGVGSMRNGSIHYCKCKQGYHQEDDKEHVFVNGEEVISHSPICGEWQSIGNSWIGTFTIVCIMLVVLLIGCFVGIIRFQRWKQRPLANTVTSLAASSGQTPHLMSSSPPPMGSVEAEFQNDFIQVFPMHHLEPLPDKNTTHYVIK